MSDSIKHECGIAFLRLKKPLDYYQKKYGTAFYGLNKMYLLMEKQHNRGQDGAGLANIKLDVAPGKRYISRVRSVDNNPIKDVFEKVMSRFDVIQENDPDKITDSQFLKDNFGFMGEVFLGHLRYGTFGGNKIEQCHPFLRQNNWMSRNLVVAGNFNLTNVDELFNLLIDLGQHPKEKTDTVTVMEKIGHFLDEENETLYQKYKALGYSNKKITEYIHQEINIARILKRSAESWDGGYVMAGLLGHGDAFVLRDPNGIRPAFWYENDEIVVVASERPVIQTTFDISWRDIQELPRGNALIIKKNGKTSIEEIREPQENLACSFERIYFSRGNDKDIYRERKELGRLMINRILEAIDHDVANTVFSFIPNTAETSFLGMIKGLEEHLSQRKMKKILELGDQITPESLGKIMSEGARVEKIAIKDAKLRTFITQDSDRDDLVAHVYDVSYGAVNNYQDNLVVIDDSIVRGTTLKTSILKILNRLKPKKIIVVSSAPQIRYPDCYGIDMARMGDFIAFQAAVSLLKEHGKEHIIETVYRKCKDQFDAPKEHVKNYVKEIYEPFTADEISKQISRLLKPDNVDVEVEIIYQTIEGLHQAIPDHPGDWYFTGNYPTPGGNKVVNRAFVYYIEGIDKRAY